MFGTIGVLFMAQWQEWAIGPASFPTLVAIKLTSAVLLLCIIIILYFQGAPQVTPPDNNMHPPHDKSPSGRQAAASS